MVAAVEIVEIVAEAEMVATEKEITATSVDTVVIVVIAVIAVVVDSVVTVEIVAEDVEIAVVVAEEAKMEAMVVVTAMVREATLFVFQTLSTNPTSSRLLRCVDCHSLVKRKKSATSSKTSVLLNATLRST